jgi:branched-chain amino acid aminotransferase
MTVAGQAHSQEWTNKIQHKLIPQESRPKAPGQGDQVSFGSVTGAHMLTSRYEPKTGWQDAIIEPYGPLNLFPDAVAFHYGQQVFEGLKAYRGNDGGIYLFRPEMNARRLHRSAERLAMVPVPEAMFLECVRDLVKVEADFVLPAPWSLYIRPFLIPLDRGVSMRASQNYLFTVIVSPVNAYYSNPDGIAVLIERSLVRAAPGGVGEAKCGGNYAASLLPMARARKLGAEQVLWLDAAEHLYVEEVGAMNIMFAYGKHIVTPKLTGSILPGITRDSILKIAPQLGLTIEERRISLSQVLADLQSGAITECFGCGTAAVVSRVNSFIDGETIHAAPAAPSLNDSVAATLKSALMGIQNGADPDPFGWRIRVV